MFRQLWHLMVKKRREREEGAPNYNWNFANGRGGGFTHDGNKNDQILIEFVIHKFESFSFSLGGVCNQLNNKMFAHNTRFLSQ